MADKIKRIVVLTVSFVAVSISVSLYMPFPKKRLAPATEISLSLLDRNNTLLREILSDEGGRCRWVTLDEVSSELVNATIAAEDRNFYIHPGINLVAITRAL